MKTIEERRDFVQNCLWDIEEKAQKVECWYTVVFFVNPLSKDLEKRTSYSEHQTDASMMARWLSDTYKKWNTPYYVFSSAYDCNCDGGFFDADKTT